MIMLINVEKTSDVDYVDNTTDRRYETEDGDVDDDESGADSTRDELHSATEWDDVLVGCDGKEQVPDSAGVRR